MLSQSQVKYQDYNYDVVIVVEQATVLKGMARSVLASAVKSEITEMGIKDPGEEFILKIVGMQTYASCVAATASVTNAQGAKTMLSEKVSFKEFLQLPESLVDLWSEAVFALNPHWVPKVTEDDEQGESSEPSEEKI